MVNKEMTSASDEESEMVWRDKTKEVLIKSFQE